MSANIVRALIHRTTTRSQINHSILILEPPTIGPLAFNIQRSILTQKPRKVRLRDDSIIYSYGISTVLLKTGISGTLYAPDLGCNLMTVGKTVQAHCQVNFDGPDNLTSRLLARGNCRQGMYELLQHSGIPFSVIRSQLLSKYHFIQY